MPIFEVNNARYHYLERGNGKALLLLHGFMGSAHSWDEIVPALSQHFRVIAVDIIGHGQSSCPANSQCYRIEQVAGDLAALLATIQAVPATLIGYSMGARLALYFALAYPEFVHKLVLESGSPGLESQDERNKRIESDNELAEFVLKEGIATFVDRWEHLPLFESQSRLPVEILIRQREQRQSNNPQGIVNSLRGMGTGSQPSMWDDLGNVHSPTLLIAGEFDSKYCVIAERMAQIMSDTTLQIVPDAGHNVHLEQPERYLQLLESFLQG